MQKNKWLVDQALELAKELYSYQTLAHVMNDTHVTKKQLFGVVIDELAHTACNDGRAGTIKQLLEHGYMPDGPKGDMIFAAAVRANNSEIIDMLVHVGIDAEAVHGDAMLSACFHQCHDAVASLLKHNVDVTSTHLAQLDINSPVYSELVNHMLQNGKEREVQAYVTCLNQDNPKRKIIAEQYKQYDISNAENTIQKEKPTNVMTM